MLFHVCDWPPQPKMCDHADCPHYKCAHCMCTRKVDWRLVYYTVCMYCIHGLIRVLLLFLVAHSFLFHAVQPNTTIKGVLHVGRRLPSCFLVCMCGVCLRAHPPIVVCESVRCPHASLLLSVYVLEYDQSFSLVTEFHVGP